MQDVLNTKYRQGDPSIDFFLYLLWKILLESKILQSFQD